jgi:predicted nuclease of predicted toxin-antitoxin system
VKLKLDENLGQRSRRAFEQAGHDVATVALQAMGGANDDELIQRCAAEERALVSLDLDFANPLRFLPSRFHGIAVLRLPDKPSAAHLDVLVNTLVAGLKQSDLQGRLWIVEMGRIRVYQEPEAGE